MKLLLTAALFGLEAAAFPSVMQMIDLEKRAGVPSTAAARKISKARTNCGAINPCITFDASEQYVSTSGANAFKAPKSTDIRGPCPGLNAAANHAYLPRSGVATILDTITGLGDAYGMTADLGGFLAAYAVIFDGDPLLGTWSIGGPPPADPLTSGLIGAAQGISYSHNVYEGDASIARFDAYLNHGDAQQLSIDRFVSAYSVGLKNDRYTLDSFVQDFVVKTEWSISHNAKYFAAPFSTTLVSPAAYNFVINFMSNHTKAEPGGYLDGSMFKQFFAIEGDYPKFTWKAGYERIPENWYRRPNNEVEGYDAASVFGDLAVGWAAYPKSFRLGGNLNGVNTYTGVDLSDFTGGLYSISDLSDYKNTTAASCFFSQVIESVIPDAASVAANELAAIEALFTKYIAAIVPSGVTCPSVGKYNTDLFNKYPGYKYDPTGVATSGGPVKGDTKSDCCGVDGYGTKP